MKLLQIDEQTQVKPIRMEDAPAAFKAVDGDRHYLRDWLPWVDATDSVQATEGFIEEALKQEASNDGLHCAIWHAGEYAGIVGFHRINRMHHQTSIGYWLGSRFQGKGIMTRTCEALVRYAFDEWLLHRVEIRCAVDNKKSASIPKRLGFRHEGTLRDAEWLYDHFVDLDVYGLLKTDREKS